jgi:hypothetical protein
MAQFDIEADALSRPDGWPDCCARCGADGTAFDPLPAKYTKGIPGARLPFCRRHSNDYADVARRTRIGGLLTLLAMPVVAAIMWILPRQPGADDTSRLIVATVSGLFSALPVGLLMLLWTKTPIRVHAVVGRFATVVAVCRKFRDAVIKSFVPEQLPDAPDDVTFDVTKYRPTPSTPADTGGLLFGSALVAGALLGALAGMLGKSLAPDALGWDRGSWWYVPAAAAAAFVFGWVCFGSAALFRLPGVGLGVFCATAFATMTTVAKLFGFSPYLWFATAYAVAPLAVLQALVLYPIIWRGKVRHGLLAGASGVVGPLAYTGAVYLSAGTASGPQSAALILGPVAMLVLGGANHETARSPFCELCSGWLTKRRIGAFGRSRAVMEPAIAGGEIVSLAREVPYQKQAEIGDTELVCYACDDCRAKGTVVLELHDCVKGGKHGTTPTLKLVDRYLYPGPALLVVNRLFPPDEETKSGAGG